MSTPSLNLDGYEKSAVTKMEGFANADFLLAHGSGDDNGASFLSPSAQHADKSARFMQFTS